MTRTPWPLARARCPATPRPTPTRTAPLQLAHPAYVIYTSGSTGRPRASSSPTPGWPASPPPRPSTTRYGPATGCCQFSSPSFDASVLELCMSLPAGAALVVPPDGPLLGDQLADVLARQHDHARADPPGGTGHRARRRRRHGLPDFRTVIVGGEACPAELVRRWAPGRRMINSYGPTESTVGGDLERPARRPASAACRSAGRSANTQVYVLDERPAAGAGRRRRRAVHRRGRAGPRLPGPPGADGRAVRRRPVRRRPAPRLYRTGDLARWPPGRPARVPRPHRRPGQDARLPHRAGRDRGRARAATPASREAVVVAREDAPGATRLVAYVVAAAGTAARPSPELRALPAAAAARVHGARRRSSLLDALPLTPNGKVDRRALPAPEPGRRPDGGLRRAAHPRRAGARRASGPRCSALDRGRRARQLLRAGRRLDPEHPGRLPRARQAGLALTPGRRLPAPDHRRAGRRWPGRPRRPPADRAGERAGAADADPALVLSEPSPPTPHHFNQSLLLELPRDSDAGRAGSGALRAVVPPRRAAHAVPAPRRAVAAAERAPAEAGASRPPGPVRRRPRTQRPPWTAAPARRRPSSTWPRARCCARCCSPPPGTRRSCC